MVSADVLAWDALGSLRSVSRRDRCARKSLPEDRFGRPGGDHCRAAMKLCVKSRSRITAHSRLFRIWRWSSEATNAVYVVWGGYILSTHKWGASSGHFRGSARE